MAKAWKNSRTSSVSKLPIFGRGEGRAQHQERPAGDVDGDPRQRLVHRQVHVGVAADAAPVAERLAHRLAERDADILDRVVVVDVQVARRRRRSRSNSAWRASWSSMWSKKPTPVAISRLRRCRRGRRLDRDLGFAASCARSRRCACSPVRSLPVQLAESAARLSSRPGRRAPLRRASARFAAHAPACLHRRRPVGATVPRAQRR